MAPVPLKGERRLVLRLAPPRADTHSHTTDRGQSLLLLPTSRGGLTFKFSTISPSTRGVAGGGNTGTHGRGEVLHEGQGGGRGGINMSRCVSRSCSRRRDAARRAPSSRSARASRNSPLCIDMVHPAVACNVPPTALMETRPINKAPSSRPRNIFQSNSPLQTFFNNRRWKILQASFYSVLMQLTEV